MQIRQQLQSNNRILHEHFPMLIEVNQDGTNLSTPRVFKLYPNTTYVGRNVKTEIGSQYIYVNIDNEIIQEKHKIHVMFRLMQMVFIPNIVKSKIKIEQSQYFLTVKLGTMENFFLNHLFFNMVH